MVCVYSYYPASHTKSQGQRWSAYIRTTQPVTLNLRVRGGLRIFVLPSQSHLISGSEVVCKYSYYPASNTKSQEQRWSAYIRTTQPVTLHLRVRGGMRIFVLPSQSHYISGSEVVCIYSYYPASNTKSQEQRWSAYIRTTQPVTLNPRVRGGLRIFVLPSQSQ